MPEPVNPYASPLADIAASSFAESGPLAAPGLKTTGIGLSLVYYGIILTLLAFVILFPGSFLLHYVALAGNNPGHLEFSLFILPTVAGAFIIIGGLLSFAGHIACLFVPPQSGARGYIIAAFFLQILNIVFFAVVILRQWAQQQEYAKIFGILVYLCGMVSAVFLVLFMRKVSQFIDRRDLMARTGNIFILGACLVGFAGFLFVASKTFPNETLVILLAFILLIAALVCFVMYANLINALRKVLLGKEKRISPTTP